MVDSLPLFPAQRGIRQGDPMSPYLFVLAMEYLGRELNQLALNGNFNYHPRCEKLNNIHICFADDLLMYCRADIVFIKLMYDAFMKFSKASTLQANIDKSSIYIAGVSDQTNQDIVEALGFSVGTLPFRYLGVPLSSKKLTVAAYFPLIEKITSKITCWFAKLLSYAGRMQLIKAVLFGVQAFWAQIFLISKKVMKTVE
ncbi:hypothetical protein KY285_015958 [Solanum tuberosum]|nr:hypothetical protein KY285_015958 [Solanum tuberosum]